MTPTKMYAQAWAYPRDNVIEVYLRRGDYVDLSRINEPDMIDELHRRHTEMLKRTWGERAGSYDRETFIKTLNQSMNHDPSEMMALLGYLGAFDPTSQIPDQVVVYDPLDIKAVSARFNPDVKKHTIHT